MLPAVLKSGKGPKLGKESEGSGLTRSLQAPAFGHRGVAGEGGAGEKPAVLKKGSLSPSPGCVPTQWKGVPAGRGGCLALCTQLICLVVVLAGVPHHLSSRERVRTVGADWGGTPSS